jgi:serpin B
VKKLFLLFCATFSFAVSSVAQHESAIDDIVKKQTQLGISLLQKSQSGKNRAISPFSIHSGLMLARLGAQGETAKQLDGLLVSSPYSPQTLTAYASLQSQILTKNDETLVSLANSIWVTDQGKFTGEYTAAATQGFKAEARSIDFVQSERARLTINKWVSDQTRTLIPDLIPSGMITRDTVATLINALYFKAAWANPFRAANTKDEKFWIDPKTSVQLAMMHLTETFGYYEDKEWQGVILPYSPPLYNFLLLVPKRSLSSAEVAAQLTPEVITAASESLSSPKVKLALPRFTVRETQNLAESLKSLGCTLPFTTSADFSKMTSIGVAISAVQHESVVIVDEKGTEAAAATAVIMAKALALINPEKPKEVTADKPFAFAILHGQTKAPLFLGVVADPR